MSSDCCRARFRAVREVYGLLCGTSPDGDYGIDAHAAVLGEADVIRTQRWLDDLERRVGRLERTTPVRIERRLRDLARKALRR